MRQGYWGFLLTDDLKFERNTQDICKRAFARISMITKLKFVGVNCHDLVDIYKLFVRSLLEYCCVSWHSSLTKEQAYDIERVQRTALKVILGDDYEDYENALITCNLENLHDRRERRCLTFGLRSLKHPKHKLMFPYSTSDQTTRNPNTFEVNFARTTSYQKSAIPYIQNILNHHFSKKKKKK